MENEESFKHHHHAGNSSVSSNEEDVVEERRHYQEIVNAFAYYSHYATSKLNRARETIAALPSIQRDLLGHDHWIRKWRRWELCIAANRALIDNMVANDPLFNDMYGSNSSLGSVRASGSNMDKVCSTLRQMVREWSLEGADERDLCYRPLIDAIEKYLPKSAQGVSSRVLCPGSGLGRLPWEICSRGYSCQGNEWSFFMLIAGNMILNQCPGIDLHTIYPFIHQTSNVRSTDDLFRPIRIPDVNPTSLPKDADFSYTAGGFLEVYGHSSQQGQWDAIVTCFFLDTANNIIEYIRGIWFALRAGGFWFNLGPLLYHYTELEHEQSVELSLDEVLAVVKAIGFELREQKILPARYTSNNRSLMNTHFEAVYWCAVKPIQ